MGYGSGKFLQSLCSFKIPPPPLLQLTKILNSFSVFDAVVSEIQWKRASIVDDYRFCVDPFYFNMEVLSVI